LVAIKDPRVESHPSVAKAAAIAAALDAPLQLFHAIADPVYLDLAIVDRARPPQIEQRKKETYRQLLEVIAIPLRHRGLSVTTAAEWDFPPHDAIIRAAANFDASLVVVGDDATVHHLPWLLRYTDWELLRASPVPVLLVKSPHPYQRPGILAALDPSRAFAKPVALDDEILRFSATLADALHGAVHAVHGYAPVPPIVSPAVLGDAAELEKLLATAERAALEALQKATDPLGISRDHLHAVGRHPVDAVEEVAAELGSQIVALGSVARSGLDRLFIGNTAEALIDRLKCDILMVKPRLFGTPSCASQVDQPRALGRRLTLRMLHPPVSSILPACSLSRY
jgi:universal stress protein E